MSLKKKDDQEYSDEEIARRRDAALLHALSTPPKPHSEMKIGKHKAETSPGAGPEGASKPRKKGKRTVR